MAVKDAWKALFKKNAEQTIQKPQGGEIGWTGNKIFAGLPQDEYNPDLIFPRSTEVYDRMRRSDGQVAAVMQAMKLPIRSTKWFVSPAEDAKDQKQAEEIAQFIEDNLMGGMKYSWDDHLREALLMLDFGFSVFEKVWRFDNWKGRRVVMLDKYAPRIASSIWRFPQNEQYDIVEVEQINYMTGQIVNIPLDKCRLYTYQREGDNPVGISALRPAYKHWYIKDALYKITAVGVEKSLIGTPYAELPPDTSEDDKEKVLNLLNAVRVSDESGATVPKGVILGMLEGKKNAMDAMPFIEHQDTLIARSVLAQFLNLGTMSSASGGAYALGREMVDMFVMGLEAVAKAIQSEVQKDVEKLVKWNFGADAPMPKLGHKDITFRDMTKVGMALGALGAGHLINPDEEMENYIRELFDLPPIPDEALRNQQFYPPNRYVPEIIPDTPLTPKEISALRKDTAIGVGSAKLPANQATGQQPVKATETSESVKMSYDQVIPGGTGGEKPEPAGTTKWRRDLNAYEKTVNLTDINNKWDQAEQQLTDDMRKVMNQSAEQYIRQVEKILNSGQTDAQKLNVINLLKPKYIGKYTDLLKQQQKELYQFGAGQVSKELGKPAQTPPPQPAALNAKAATLATLQMQKMASAIQLSVISGIERGIPNKKVVYDAKQRAQDYIDGPDLKAAATITVSDSINIGRGSQAKQIGVMGAVWSAIMDAKTCPLCAELDEQVISTDNPDFDIFRPPAHSGCRCILIYIEEGSTNVNFNWKTPSGELVKHYGHLIT